MEDQPLSHAIILDTKEDVYTKMLVTCHGCGNELEVKEVQEKPEVAIILAVCVCSTCSVDAYQDGFYKGETDSTRGF